MNLLSTLFAKTIELSFVTVFVAFLGQVLSRRAFLAKARGGGVSIAEMMMRTWIMQPGTMITHAETVRYAGPTFLGAVALIAAFIAMFYVTAAEALVSPKLRLGPVEDRTLQGLVHAGFGNVTYLQQSCTSPIDIADDPDFKGSTCLHIDFAGQAFQNYKLYLDDWTGNLKQNPNQNITYADRPPPMGVLFDNTTVQGQWIPTSDEVVFREGGRVIQNLTMAMPHANIFNAARDPANNILQPNELSKGEGVYSIKASVPAPTVNILCAEVAAKDIKSLIYSSWPGNNGSFDLDTWPHEQDDMLQWPRHPNATAIDDLFDFGRDAGDARQRAPIFPKLPTPYNTLVNGTGEWPEHSLYLLAGAPDNETANPYLFCSLKAMQYPHCTTQYHATKAGGNLTVHCDQDPENTIPYSSIHPKAPTGEWNPDWKNVASDWATAVSLNAGRNNGDAAISRLLTQMMVRDYSGEASLDPSLPSVAESLGVLVGCTLGLSSFHAPFVHHWNYPESQDVPSAPQYESFEASVRYQDYASGITDRWEGMFYVVLVLVFVTNCYCTAYLIWTMRSEGQVTDYTEPQNMFALAVNSPPSRTLAGACGAGPEGYMLAKKWEVEMQSSSTNTGDGRRQIGRASCRER